MNNDFSKFESDLRASRANNNNVFVRKDSIDPEQKKVITNIFDKIIYVSFFMLFVGVPLFFLGISFQGVIFEKQIYFYFWVLVALVSWVAKGAVTGEMRIKRTPLDIPILALLVIYIISTFFSVDRWHSFWGFFGDPSRGLMMVLASVVTYYLVVSNFNKSNFNWILGGLVASSFFISVFSILILFGVKVAPASIAKFIPLSLVGTVSGLKIFSGMMIPLIMIASFKLNESKNKFSKILSYLVLITIPVNLLLISMVFDQTIGMIILFGIGFFLLYILSHVVRPKENMTWVPMVVFVLGMIVLMSGKNNLVKVNVPVEVAPHIKISWEIVKGGIKDDPFFGSGPATYGYAFSKYKPQSFNNDIFYGIRFYQGAGLFFESLSTVGVLGAIGLLALTVVFINITIYLISRDKEKNKIYSLGFLSASLILVISSFIFRVEGTILLMGVLIGSLAISLILMESGIEGKDLKLSLKASPKFALTLAFIFIIVSAGVATLFVYIGKAFVADIYAGKAVRESRVSEEGSIKSLINAITLNRREGRYFSRVGQEYMVLANEEALKGEGKMDTEKLSLFANRAVAYAKEGALRMPNDALAVSVMAQVYEGLSLHVNGTLESSAKAYEELLVLEPHNPVAYLKLGQIKLVPAISEKDEEKKKTIVKSAKEYFEKSVKEKDNFAEGNYYLAISQNALGQKDEVVKSMVKAVNSDPNNVTYLFNLGRSYQEMGTQDDLNKAKDIFEYIVKKNPKEINTVFALGTLYEGMGEKDKSIEKYREVIELLRKMGGNSDDTISKLNKMIDNVRNGISNKNAVLESQNGANQNANRNTQDNVELIGSEATQNPVNDTNPPIESVNQINQ